MAAQIVAHVSIYDADVVRASVAAPEGGGTFLYLRFSDPAKFDQKIAVHDLPADYMHRLAQAINAVPLVVEPPAQPTAATLVGWEAA